ncbi:MAG: SNF2-related protein [Bilophila wadsworthia]
MGFGTRAPYRLILTGTPIQQGIEDLYTQMEFLSPLILGYPQGMPSRVLLLFFKTESRLFQLKASALMKSAAP